MNCETMSIFEFFGGDGQPLKYAADFLYRG